MQPSETFGQILHAAYDAQLEGTFFDLSGALEWLKKHEVAHKRSA
jgi:hypothetical protein